MKEHEKKILTQYFKEVINGNKPFELRLNDCNYEVGDTLLLKEIENKNHESALGNFLISVYTGQEITKEISYIYKGKGYGLEEGYCILGLKQEGIQLKNIDLTGISVEEQRKKVNEEEQEFKSAYIDYMITKTEKNKIHVIDELLDEFQSKLGLVEKEGIKAEEVQAYYSTWVRKLENRPRKKECKKCINKSNCCLYLSEHWDGEQEAEACKTYIEKER